MYTSKRRTALFLLFLLTTFGGNTVLADDQAALPTDAVMASFGQPVSHEALNALSGGQQVDIASIDLLINTMQLNSKLENTYLHSATTGVNAISGDAFANASGISTVIQNSGNQVIINSALILNVRLQ